MIDVKEFIKQKHPLLTDAHFTGEELIMIHLPDVVKLMEEMQRLLQQCSVVRCNYRL